MKFCITCSMPMVEAKDFGCGDTTKETCIHCTNGDGSIKTCEEIFEGGVNFFVGVIGKDKNLAEKLVRYNMTNNCPYRKDKNFDCLLGDMVSKKEFEKIIILG